MTSRAGTAAAETSWGAGGTARPRNLAWPPARLPEARARVLSGPAPAGEDVAWLRRRAAGSAAPELGAGAILVLATILLGGLTLWAVAPVQNPGSEPPAVAAADRAP
jgi:hypothetical protein